MGLSIVVNDDDFAVRDEEGIMSKLSLCDLFAVDTGSVGQDASSHRQHRQYLINRKKIHAHAASRLEMSPIWDGWMDIF